MKTNIREQLSFLSAVNRRLKKSLNEHKHLPVGHCIVANLSYRHTRDVIQSIRKAVGRAK